MEKAPLFLLLSILAFSALAASDAADNSTGCLSELGSKASLIPFNTTDFHCENVWSQENFTLAYKQTNGSVWSFVLAAPDTKVYIGIGFSTDGRMAGTSAVVGWLAADGKGIAKQYLLAGFMPAEVKPDTGELLLVSNKTVLVKQSDTLYLAFQINVTSGEPRDKLLYALGPDNFVPGSDFLLSHHKNRTSTVIKYVTDAGSGGGSSTGGGSTGGSPSAPSPAGGPSASTGSAWKLSGDGFLATIFAVAVYSALRLL